METYSHQSFIHDSWIGNDFVTDSHSHFPLELILSFTWRVWTLPFNFTVIFAFYLPRMHFIYALLYDVRKKEDTGATQHDWARVCQDIIDHGWTYMMSRYDALNNKTGLFLWSDSKEMVKGQDEMLMNESRISKKYVILSLIHLRLSHRTFILMKRRNLFIISEEDVILLLIHLKLSYWTLILINQWNLSMIPKDDVILSIIHLNIGHWTLILMKQQNLFMIP